MRSSPLGAVVVLCALLAPGARAVAQDWPPVTDQEKALTDCPRQPGAAAVVLYREEVVSHRTWTVSCFYRLKVLTPAGRERANIEIPVYKGWYKVADMKARVVRPDGTAAPYKGRVFEKTVLRAGGIRVTVKSFALPDVEIGSIIDYGYRLVPDDEKISGKGQEILEELFGRSWKPEEGGIDTEKGILFFPVTTWDVQADLFTLRARFGYEPSRQLGIALAEWSQRAMSFSWATRWLPGVEPSGDHEFVQFDLANIAAFEPEEFMPPESSQRQEVRLFYIAGTAGSPSAYWRDESQNWIRGLEKFMQKTGAAAVEARKAVAGLDDPEAQVLALYERAQRIKNLSYDRTKPPRKRKELGIRDNRSVADVLKNNYGLRSDITRTFAALAASAGFPSRVVRVASRDDKLFELNQFDLYSQFDTELAVVQVGGTDRFYDPATPLCPPGLIPWKCTSTSMLDPAGDPPSAAKMPAKTPDGTPEQARVRREVALRLAAEGRLTGTIKVRFGGQEGLRLKLDHLTADEDTMKKDLEAELGGILPAGAMITLQGVENLKNAADEVVASFEVTLPPLTTNAGDRTLLPASPILGVYRDSLRHAQRKHPLSFPHPYWESDDIVISLPEGMRIEAFPAPRNESQDGLEHSLSCAAEDGTTLRVRREFKLKTCDHPVTFYDSVRAFFDRVRAADEERVVLAVAKRRP